MLLNLDDNYRVTMTDGRNWTLEKLTNVEDRKTNEIKREWKVRGYYGKFLHALNTYTTEELVKDENKATVQELINLIHKAIKHNEQIVDNANIDWDYSKKAAKDE